MKQTLKLFQIGLCQILRDGMLLVLLPAPILVGLAFRLGLPFVNAVLENRFTFSLEPWYGLADGLLTCLSPMLVSMVSAFLLLEERDENILAFYQVTPMEGGSYLTARIVMPMLWAFVSTLVAGLTFHLSGTSFATIFASSVVSAFMGVFLSMMIVSLAGNRVEGLAFSKLTGISLIGLILVWFAPIPYQIIGAILPSYWIGVIVNNGVDFTSFSLGMLTCLVWTVIFTRKLQREL